MSRLEVVCEISDILDNDCRNCEKRLELNRLYGCKFAQIDGYCNRECPVGQVLQAWGRKLGRSQS